MRSVQGVLAPEEIHTLQSMYQGSAFGRKTVHALRQASMEAPLVPSAKQQLALEEQEALERLILISRIGCLLCVGTDRHLQIQRWC